MPETLSTRAAADVQTINHALNVFVQGFAFTRSFTHPYVPEHVEGLWALRDAPRRSGTCRSEEWFAHGMPPAEVDRIVRAHHRGRFAICAVLPVNEPDANLRAGYKALGYRLRTTEPIMVHPLRRIPRCSSPATIERVITPALAQRLAQAAKARQVLPEHLTVKNPPLRQYVATMDGELVGWVRSIVVGDGAWCSNMYVVPRHRRQGIARALLARMLRDDRAAGATTAVLSASHAGAKLYTTLGYRQLATLYMWSTGKR
ncbi:MAG: GNAT family N-acetyltransferase [Phycisphaeraceae bacterium]